MNSIKLKKKWIKFLLFNKTKNAWFPSNIFYKSNLFIKEQKILSKIKIVLIHLTEYIFIHKIRKKIIFTYKSFKLILLSFFCEGIIISLNLLFHFFFIISQIIKYFYIFKVKVFKIRFNIRYHFI